MKTISAILFFAFLTSTMLASPKPLASYQTLVLEPFTVDPDLVKTEFPPAYQNVLQKTLFARLLSERVFETVTDASLEPEAAKAGCRTLPQTGGCAGTVIASGEIVNYSKGNRAARVIINYGAGAARLKIVMVFRDAQTGKELLRLEQEGSYAGFGNITGGSAQKARLESARKVVDGLMKKIRAAK
jgi:Domain of unknown function (DUF4410)